VPVHPVLARTLAEWKVGGWVRMMGREPAEGDLIVPSRLGDHRSVNHSLKRFYEDLDRLGFRHRRQHDLRRSFITLARSDGARKDVLETVSHGARGDIIDMYTSLPWATLCEAVACLQIAARKSAEAGEAEGEFGTVLGTMRQGAYVPDEKSLKLRELQAFDVWRGGRDLNLPNPTG
jgi:hypothetical protein